MSWGFLWTLIQSHDLCHAATVKACFVCRDITASVRLCSPWGCMKWLSKPTPPPVLCVRATRRDSKTWTNKSRNSSLIWHQSKVFHRSGVINTESGPQDVHIFLFGYSLNIILYKKNKKKTDYLLPRRKQQVKDVICNIPASKQDLCLWVLLYFYDLKAAFSSYCVYEYE